MNNVDTTLIARESTHGDYAARSLIAQQLKDVMRSTPGWSNLTSIMLESLEMEAVKTSRILAGNPYEADHWLDKAGYAKLVYDIVKIPEASVDQAVRDLVVRVNNSEG